jgi:hypothetical protein
MNGADFACDPADGFRIQAIGLIAHQPLARKFEKDPAVFGLS